MFLLCSVYPTTDPYRSFPPHGLPPPRRAPRPRARRYACTRLLCLSSPVSFLLFRGARRRVSLSLWTLAERETHPWPAVLSRAFTDARLRLLIRCSVFTASFQSNNECTLDNTTAGPEQFRFVAAGFTSAPRHLLLNAAFWAPGILRWELFILTQYHAAPRVRGRAAKLERGRVRGVLSQFSLCRV